MSGRSSRRELALLAVLVTACSGKKQGPPPPEADPAQLAAVLTKVHTNIPAPGAVRDCTPADFKGGAALTFRTLLEIEGTPIAPKDDTLARWINPTELDAPAARTLDDPKADTTAKRRAAAALLAAPFYVLYHVDMVNAPMALGIKELKIGTVGSRIIRYEKTGLPTCVQLFLFQNDRARSDWAISKSDRATVDPAVAQALKDDLAAQFIAKAPRP